MSYLDNTGFLEQCRKERMSVIRKAKAIADAARDAAERERLEEAAHAERERARFTHQCELLRQAVLHELDGAETRHGDLYAATCPVSFGQAQFRVARVYCGARRDDMYGRYIDFMVDEQLRVSFGIHNPGINGYNREHDGRTVEELFEKLPPVLAEWM